MGLITEFMGITITVDHIIILVGYLDKNNEVKYIIPDGNQHSMLDPVHHR